MPHNWEQIIQNQANIPGKIEKIIPFPSQENRVIVINKVWLYAVRSFEYNPDTKKLTELKRFAKNKAGYPTLETALDKAKRIPEEEIEEALKKLFREKGGFGAGEWTQKLHTFKTLSNRSYAIVITKIIQYAVRIVEYQITDNKVKFLSEVKRYPTSYTITFYLWKEALAKSLDLELEKQAEDDPIFIKENNTLNILLLGRTGDGKSALGNVISGTNNFAESSGSVSNTKDIQTTEFEIENVKYCVIDTIGIGDTNLWTNNKEIVLAKILAAATYSLNNGLNQVLFVNKGKLTKEVISAYNLLQTIIFDENIGQYTTIVRTDFPEFREPTKLYEDCKKMIRESDKIVELMRSCKDIIYVNNPPLSGKEEEIIMNQSIREESKVILRNYLSTCEEVYQPSEDLTNLTKEINQYNKKIEILDKRITEINNPYDKTLLSLYEEKKQALKLESLQKVKDYIEKKTQQQNDNSSLATVETKPTPLTSSSVSMFAGVILGTFAKSFVNTVVPGLADLLGKLTLSALGK